ncbi:lytic transglycosylase domain-containing protein [Notoacmeibacter ruber]|uniref:Lytic transglycosylase n=1 Tax=Notoacmeibacter ruber TaxID=2670375 RepID=A0A3L7JE53_9HYPH|nr:lytic transglycosylase domain-containing protein [Notoacmeibacter ruber]RLQ88750.1 lytic transglycosylase [Notoacmeibacter ruber]
MRGGWIASATFLLSVSISQPAASAPLDDPAAHVARVCTIIKAEAERHDLPAAFFARLVWTESRFDPGAVSPVGAEGIAQFMPGTAKLRGLADSFDMTSALAASASYLAEMRDRYGNLGRAAIGYNAGEERLRRWIGGHPFLPLETENYVLKVLQQPAERFAKADYRAPIAPLSEKHSFLEGCKRLPVIRTRAPDVARLSKPWLVQLAGSFRRGAAERQLEQLRQRYALVERSGPVITRLRRPGARARIYAVGIGADSRGEASRLCGELRRAGASCLVQRNR